MKQTVSMLLISFSCFMLRAQQGDLIDSNHLNSFIRPVNIPISLAGNFGELRPGHFHAGLDIRTQGKEGIPVLAIEDGYVSRIAVSLYGYGKVLYITHQNGFTSVYAHLKEFGDGIEQIVKEIQYSNRNFVFDTTFESKNILVKQGQMIGLSGNTGGSGGPHLHFEIRNSLTERAINPLHFYPDLVSDKIAPEIRTLSIYPLNENSSVNGMNKALHLKVVKNGPQYSISNSMKLVLKGKIGFGIETRDHLNNSPFKIGAYSVSLMKNNTPVFTSKMDSISFDHTRCINVHMDYYQARKNKKKVEKSFVQKGNKLQIYGDLINDGKLFFLTDTNYQMRYAISDFQNNTSTLDFEVIGSSNLVKSSEEEDSFSKLLIAGEDNFFESDEIHIRWPSECLYDDLKFETSKKSKIGRCQTPRYQIHNLYEPLNDYMNLSINISHLPPNIHHKCVVMSLNEQSKVLAAEGGTVDSGWISAKTRSFGPYTVFVDTIPPQVKPINFYSGKNMTSTSIIRFSMKDNISGIKKYQAYVDEQWVLLEYQRNKRIGFIKLIDLTQQNKERQLKVVISDGVGNAKELEYQFFY